MKNPIYIVEVTHERNNITSVREVALVASPTKTLADLAYAILAAFNIGGEHLFEFSRPLSKIESRNHQSFRKYILTHEERLIRGLVDFFDQPSETYTYYLPTPDGDIPLENYIYSKSVFEAKLVKVLYMTGQHLTMLYDFGLGTEFDIVLKSVVVDQSTDFRQYPKILSGTGSNLIENEIEIPKDLNIPELDFSYDKEWFKHEVRSLKRIYEGL